MLNTYLAKELKWSQELILKSYNLPSKKSKLQIEGGKKRKKKALFPFHIKEMHHCKH
jgi:hypothetical protein